MWKAILPDFPVPATTTSVWQHSNIMLIGVMRGMFLAPPYLWAQVLTAGVRNVRRAPVLLTELQNILSAPTVYAEAELHIPRNQALLAYLGFEEIAAASGRKLYKRSL